MSLSFENTALAFRYKSDKKLRKAHFLFKAMQYPLLTRAGMKMAEWVMRYNLPFTKIIKNTIFIQFCGGESLEEAAETTLHLNKYKVGVALDYGVEGKESEEDFINAVEEFKRAIRFAAQSNATIDFIPIKVTGFAQFNLLAKLDEGALLTTSEEAAWQKVQDRMFEIAEVASAHNIKLLIDAEHSWIQRPLDDLTDRLMEKYNKEYPLIYNTFQLYRHDRFSFLKKSHKKAQENGYVLGAKLVRGAYMELERQRAFEKGYPSPINATKTDTDRDYDAAVKYCIQHLGEIAVFIGTHNEESCMKAAKLMDEKGIDHQDHFVYFSQLFGMSDNITFNLADAGFKVGKYLPYGPVKDVIPYLIRRAEENSSVSGQTDREYQLLKKEMERRKSVGS